MKRTFIIGDVHGCIRELRALVRDLDPIASDRFIFVGDLCDKGPDSIAVIRYARDLVGRFPGSVVVQGNHEAKMLHFYKRGKLDTLRSQSRQWAHDATEADWAFIASMPVTWADGGFRVIHGGIFPRLLRLHPDVFKRFDAGEKVGGKAKKRLERCKYVRYVGGDHRPEGVKGEPSPGDHVSLGENVEGDPFWADVYDGSQGRVIYGHSPQLSGLPRHSDHAICVDTACVFGGRLTAAVVNSFPTGVNEIVFVSVPAEKQYAIPREDD